MKEILYLLSSTSIPGYIGDLCDRISCPQIEECGKRVYPSNCSSCCSFSFHNHYWLYRDPLFFALASNYRTICDVTLIVKFESSAPILKVVECCRNLKRLVFIDRGREYQKNSDILASCLKILAIRSVMLEHRDLALMVGSIMSGFKKLAKLKVNERSIRPSGDRLRWILIERVVSVQF